MRKRISSLGRLRRWIAPLAFTPLHPQWLVLRARGKTAIFVGEVAHGRVLDIGCGDRWAESVLSETASYVGLDYPTTISLGYVGKPTILGDATFLPFADSSFDTVLLLDVLEHLADPERAIREVYRVLKSGGVFVVQTPFLYPLHDEPHDFYRWTHYGLHALISRCGMEVKKIIHYGNPAETAAALFAVALAKGVIDAVRRRHFSLLIVPVLVLAVPFFNLSGLLLGWLMPDSRFMPLGYRVIGVKTE